ncbi:MAG: NlpC/P60 family protein [Clostridia bacterium]|jgi:hypothetical protein|nr:NlpC/P60 family protein [Clostridia bacterium]
MNKLYKSLIGILFVFAIGFLNSFAEIELSETFSGEIVTTSNNFELLDLVNGKYSVIINGEKKEITKSKYPEKLKDILKEKYNEASDVIEHIKFNDENRIIYQEEGSIKIKYTLLNGEEVIINLSDETKEDEDDNFGYEIDPLEKGIIISIYEEKNGIFYYKVRDHLDIKDINKLVDFKKVDDTLVKYIDYYGRKMELDLETEKMYLNSKPSFEETDNIITNQIYARGIEKRIYAEGNYIIYKFPKFEKVKITVFEKVYDQEGAELKKKVAEFWIEDEKLKHTILNEIGIDKLTIKDNNTSIIIRLISLIEVLGPITIFLVVIAIGVRMMISKAAPTERAQAMYSLVYVAIGGLILSNLVLFGNFFRTITEENIVRTSRYEENVDEYPSVALVAEAERDSNGEFEKPENFTDRNFASFLNSIIKILQDGKTWIFKSDASIDRMVFLRVKEGERILDIEPFTPTEWNSIMKLYKIIMAFSLPLIIVIVAKTGYDYISKGFSAFERKKIKSSYVRWLASIFLITMFPHLYRIVMSFIIEATYAIPLNDTLEIAPILTGRDVGSTVILKTIFVWIEFNIFLMLAVRKVMISLFLPLAPVALVLWGISPEVEMGEIWIKELVSNMIMQIAYAIGLFFAIVFIHVGDYNWIYNAIWLIAALQIGETIRNSIYVNPYKRMHGIDEKNMAKGLGSKLNVVSFVSGKLGTWDKMKEANFKRVHGKDGEKRYKEHKKKKAEKRVQRGANVLKKIGKGFKKLWQLIKLLFTTPPICYITWVVTVLIIVMYIVSVMLNLHTYDKKLSMASIVIDKANISNEDVFNLSTELAEKAIDAFKSMGEEEYLDLAARSIKYKTGEDYGEILDAQLEVDNALSEADKRSLEDAKKEAGIKTETEVKNVNSNANSSSQFGVGGIDGLNKSIDDANQITDDFIENKIENKKDEIREDALTDYNDMIKFLDMERATYFQLIKSYDEDEYEDRAIKVDIIKDHIEINEEYESHMEEDAWRRKERMVSTKFTDHIKEDESYVPEEKQYGIYYDERLPWQFVAAFKKHFVVNESGKLDEFLKGIYKPATDNIYDSGLLTNKEYIFPNQTGINNVEDKIKAVDNRFLDYGKEYPKKLVKNKIVDWYVKDDGEIYKPEYEDGIIVSEVAEFEGNPLDEYETDKVKDIITMKVEIYNLEVDKKDNGKKYFKDTDEPDFVAENYYQRVYVDKEIARTRASFLEKSKKDMFINKDIAYKVRQKVKVKEPKELKKSQILDRNEEFERKTYEPDITHESLGEGDYSSDIEITEELEEFMEDLEDVGFDDMNRYVRIEVSYSGVREETSVSRYIQEDTSLTKVEDKSDRFLRILQDSMRGEFYNKRRYYGLDTYQLFDYTMGTYLKTVDDFPGGRNSIRRTIVPRTDSDIRGYTNEYMIYLDKNANNIHNLLANLSEINQFVENFNIPQIGDRFERADFVEVATSVLGLPYFWGGRTYTTGQYNEKWFTLQEVTAAGNEKNQPPGSNQPFGFDCSGFVHWVYKHFISSDEMNGAANSQFKNCDIVSESELEIGDLGFYDNPYTNSKGKAKHVGIYIGVDEETGNKMFIHAGGKTWKVPGDPLRKNGRVLVSYNISDGSAAKPKDYFKGNEPSRFKYFGKPRISKYKGDFIDE